VGRKDVPWSVEETESVEGGEGGKRPSSLSSLPPSLSSSSMLLLLLGLQYLRPYTLTVGAAWCERFEK